MIELGNWHRSIHKGRGISASIFRHHAAGLWPEYPKTSVGGWWLQLRWGKWSKAFLLQADRRRETNDTFVYGTNTLTPLPFRRRVKRTLHAILWNLGVRP